MACHFTSTSKINLFLNITAKDPIDNYHFLESIFVEIPWGDDFTIRTADIDEVVFLGLGAEKIGSSNTVSKVLALFKEKYSIKDCSTISPLPLTWAEPPYRKNGISLPTLAAISNVSL